MSAANSERRCAIDDLKPGVEILRDLWRSELDILLATISNGRRNHEEIHRSAQHVSSDYQGRFLIELIQNANDQARLAALESSTVKILRTDRFVAVSNEGLPFDEGKVQGVTSIFLSDKPPDLCIGNKGIGFKAVFEIAEEAEIYSASNGRNLAEDCSLAFRIVREPLDDLELRIEFTRIAQELLDRNPERATALRALRPGVPPIDQMLLEAAKAAWFKFPLPADHARLIAHLAGAGLGKAFLQQCQTMVLLPIRCTVRSQQTVSTAVSEIVGKIDGTANGSTNAAAAMLFLDGITRLEVADHVAGTVAAIERHPSTNRAQLEGGIVLDRCVITQQITTRSESEEPTTQTLASHWWIARRTLGAQTGDDHTSAEVERKAIRDAIATLDLPANWQDVEQATVSVAIPVPGDPAASSHDWCSALSADGHFCIGLPTKVATGTPFWVDAHFHGSIARTEIEFEKNDYNILLLDSALDLVSALVVQLKEDDRIRIRRCATLAMWRTSGRLADMLYRPGGLAASEVVLVENGHDFARANDLRMPRREDLEVFREIVSGIDVSAYGLRLPDPKLLESARDLIDALAREAPVVVEYIIYTRRPDGLALSLVEDAAKRNRHSGPKFWNCFLKWLLDRFQPIEPLLNQKILPVGRDELETSSARVFLPPMTVISPDAAAQDAKPAAADDEEEAELDAIDDDIADRLRFLDDHAVEVRAEKAGERTKLARRLAPNVGEGLVR